MTKENFIKYNHIHKMLNDNGFFGLNAKRINNGRITYSFKNIRWNNFLVNVETLKLNPQEITSEKIVLGIKVNDKQLDTLKDFIKFLKFPPSIKKYNDTQTK